MKRISLLIMLIILTLTFPGCQFKQDNAQVVATTLPVYEFTAYICQGTNIRVARLVTESVSCLHDYTLKVSQMRAIESAELIMISGAGLEEFLNDALSSRNNIIDTSEGITLICHEGSEHSHEHAHVHSHENDPHIWLSPLNAKTMARNVYQGLVSQYPEHETLFTKNLSALESELDTLMSYAQTQLQSLGNREIITFHDGFSYMAEAFDLSILHAVEEESGSEASAAELISLVRIVTDHQLNAIFTECNGSSAAASVISQETGVSVYALDMAMSDRNYFEAMYHNIDTLREALQ